MCDAAPPMASDIPSSVRCTGVEAHDLPSGGSVYVYVLECRFASGAVAWRRPQRYSAWRAIHRVVREAADPSRSAALPEFPAKANWTRQTPAFLAARGKAIERYLAAVLAVPVLASLPKDASIYNFSLEEARVLLERKMLRGAAGRGRGRGRGRGQAAGRGAKAKARAR